MFEHSTGGGPHNVCLWRSNSGRNAWAGLKRRESPSVTRDGAGSCAPDGTLRFNWRVAMLQPELTEHVAVHELAHLKVSSHSTEYWAQVSSLLPNAQQRRHRLREAGKMLPI